MEVPIHEDSDYDEYTYSFTVINEYCIETLYLQVKGKVYPNEFYFQQLTYDQLSDSIKQYFESLNNICTYMNYSGTCCFDRTEVAVKIYVPTDVQTRELVIPLKAENRLEALKEKVRMVEEYDAKMDKYYVDALGKRQLEFQELESQMLDLKVQDKHVADTWQRLTTYEFQLIKKLWVLDEQCQQEEKNIERQGLTRVYFKDILQLRLLRNTLPMQNEFNNVKIQCLSSDQCQSKRKEHPVGAEFWTKKHEAWMKLFRERRQKLFPKNDPLATFFLTKKNFLNQVKFTLSNHPTKTMKFIELFCNLEELCLRRCKIIQIKGLLHLKHLRILKLSKNNIREISGLNFNTLLEVLDLSSNNIILISGIFHLDKLRILKLNHNKIDRIPKQIQKLSELRQMHINDNWIIGISRSMAKMDKFQYLSMIANRCPRLHKSRLNRVIEKLQDKCITVDTENEE